MYDHIIIEISAIPPGTSEGAILVYSVSNTGDKIELTKQLEGHSAPISDIVTDTKGQLLSADEHGTIILWQDIAVSKESSVVISDSR